MQPNGHRRRRRRVRLSRRLWGPSFAAAIKRSRRPRRPPASNALSSWKTAIRRSGTRPAGLQDAEKELNLKDAGLRATLEVNDGTPGGQLEKLQQLNSQSDIAGVGVSALDADNVAVVEELRKLQKKGVQVVTVDSDVSRDRFRDAASPSSAPTTGSAARSWAAALGLRPAGGGYVTFVGRTGAQNAIERIEGFKEGAGPKFQSLDSMADDTDRAAPATTSATPSRITRTS